MPRNWTRIAALALAGMIMTAMSARAGDPTASLRQGNPPIKSAGPLGASGVRLWARRGAPGCQTSTGRVWVSGASGCRRVWVSARLGGRVWVSDWARLGRVWVSDLVLGSRLDPRHDLLEFIGQFGMGSQASVYAAGQVGNAVGTRQAK